MFIVRGRLAPRDLPILAEAVLFTVVVHVGLRYARLQPLLSALDRVPPTAAGIPADRVARVSRLAEGVSRRLSLDPTCLKGGLVAYALLRRRRVNVSLVIGGRPGAERFEAHAWLEHEGRVLCGAPRHAEFQELWRAPRLLTQDTAP